MIHRLMPLALLLPLAALAAPLQGAPASAPGVAPDLLPRPAALEPAVAFWARVYSEVGTDGGLVHDNRYLDVVYAVVRFPEDAGWYTERQLIDSVTERYRNIVRDLAAGRAPAGEEARRVAELWRGHGDTALANAAGRLRFQRGQANRFQAGIVRSGAWQGFIRDTLRTAEVPEALAALPHVESSFLPTARSHAGAAGLWQFTSSTGRRYMQIDHVVDERLDPFLSTRAAVQLLRHNYEVTGAWPLAITAYNHGAAGMRRAVEQLGTRDIGVIAWDYRSRSFGFASRNFYAAFLAALDVEARADELFGPVARLPASADRVIAMPDYIGVGSLAAALGVELPVLRQFNPALGPPVWNGEKRWPRDFPLRLPNDRGAADLQHALAGIPATQRYDAQVPDKYHEVGRGEALSLIAARYDTTVRELVDLNGLRDPHRIRAGTVLLLPGVMIEAPAAQPAVAQPAVLQTAEPAITEVSLVDPEAAAAAITEPDHPDPDEIGMPRALGADPSDFDVAADATIEIQPFETLGHYADWLGVPARHLRQLNGLRQNTLLVVGRRLTLDFARVDRATFEARRREYQRLLQEDFFTRYRITGTVEQDIRAGDSLWRLSNRFADVPIWLLRQYNPDLDFASLRPGSTVLVPVVEQVAEDDVEQAAADCVC